MSLCLSLQHYTINNVHVLQVYRISCLHEFCFSLQIYIFMEILNLSSLPSCHLSDCELNTSTFHTWIPLIHGALSDIDFFHTWSPFIFGVLLYMKPFHTWSPFIHWVLSFMESFHTCSSFIHGVLSEMESFQTWSTFINGILSYTEYFHTRSTFRHEFL